MVDDPEGATLNATNRRRSGRPLHDRRISSTRRPRTLVYIATLTRDTVTRISMARKVTTVIEMTDDPDGGKAEQTVRFARRQPVRDRPVKEERQRAAEALKPYLDHGRRVRAARGRAASTPRCAKRADLAEVRTWAKVNGFEISDRGRIPATVLNAFGAS
jgi:Lsr2